MSDFSPVMLNVIMSEKLVAREMENIWWSMTVPQNTRVKVVFLVDRMLELARVRQ